MQDLSALTPPLLVCVVVIIAIVAFLRHEMNRSRTHKSTQAEKISGTAPKPGDDLQSRQPDDADAHRTTSADS